MKFADAFKANGFGWTGNALGLFALYPLFHVALFGRSVSGNSGSATISRADGYTVTVIQTNQDLFPVYLMLTLYGLCPLALILGLIGLKKDRDRLIAGVAVLYGFALVWVMTISTVLFYPALAACTLSLAAVHLHRGCKPA